MEQLASGWVLRGRRRVWRRVVGSGSTVWRSALSALHADTKSASARPRIFQRQNAVPLFGNSLLGVVKKDNDDANQHQFRVITVSTRYLKTTPTIHATRHTDSHMCTLSLFCLTVFPRFPVQAFTCISGVLAP